MGCRRGEGGTNCETISTICNRFEGEKSDTRQGTSNGVSGEEEKEGKEGRMALRGRGLGEKGAAG